MFPERLKTSTRTGVAVALAVGCALVVSLSAQTIGIWATRAAVGRAIRWSWKPRT